MEISTARKGEARYNVTVKPCGTYFRNSLQCLSWLLVTDSLVKLNNAKKHNREKLILQSKKNWVSWVSVLKNIKLCLLEGHHATWHSGCQKRHQVSLANRLSVQQIKFILIPWVKEVFHSAASGNRPSEQMICYCHDLYNSLTKMYSTPEKKIDVNNLKGTYLTNATSKNTQCVRCNKQQITPTSLSSTRPFSAGVMASTAITASIQSIFWVAISTADFKISPGKASETASNTDMILSHSFAWARVLRCKT